MTPTTLQDKIFPAVTVAIPTYKGVAHLGTAIESVLNQTFVDLELLVIDDNSPDETASLVKRYRDPRLKYFRNADNLGPEGNWNRCLELACGKYFKLLPHDDVLSANCLERQVTALDADVDNQIALVFGPRAVLRPDGVAVARRGFPVSAEGRKDAEDVRRACVRRGTNLIGEPGAILFRQSLAQKVGKFSAVNPYVIDLDYWFRLLQHGDGYYCNEVLAGFRVSPTSWSVAIGSSQARDFRMFVDRIDSGATIWDRLTGRVNAQVNNLGRLLFYRVFLR